jgi:ribosome-interacting GTPase 1
MPHQVQMQLIKRRLVGKEGNDRVRELRSILRDLPDYKNGPYADIRKWVHGEIERTRVRSRVVHRDSIAVRREGVAQVALVGAPNMGKSSLLQAVSDIQIRTGDYPFTTLRPVAAVTRIQGLPVQLVEIPGLITGASEDLGGGRALLGVLRGADAIVYCHEASRPLDALEEVRAEVEAAGISPPALLAATKADEASPAAIARLRLAAGDLRVVFVSILDDASLERFRDAVWRLTGLMRVFTRRHGSESANPMAVHPGARVMDVARDLHRELAGSCRGAHVWGTSVRFPGQLVGRDHRLEDDDIIEVIGQGAGSVTSGRADRPRSTR